MGLAVNRPVARTMMQLIRFGGLVLFLRFTHRLGLQTLLGRRVWYSQHTNRSRVGGSLPALLDPFILGLGPDRDHPAVAV